MKLFKWSPGRQLGCDYKKFCFLYCRLGRWGFDGYILKYEPYSWLPWHTDPVPGKHWRLNIPLKGKSRFFIKKECSKYHTGIVFFRPDKYEHGLLVSRNKVWKLSLGFVKFDK